MDPKTSVQISIYVVLAVVGNKIDRYEDEEVEYAVAKDYATEIGAVFKLVSAKEGKNISDLFATVAERVVSSGNINTRTQGDKPKPKPKKGKCC